VEKSSVRAADADECLDFLANLTAEFKITSAPISHFFGIEVKQLEDGSVFITQEAYTKKVLRRFHMSESKPVETPTVSEQDPEVSVTKELARSKNSLE